MIPIKYNQLDCQTFADALNEKAVVTELEDLTGKVPHVGYGGASKSSYTSPKTGRTVYVLERNGMYSADAWTNDVWQFNTDFSTEKAATFLANFDAIFPLWRAHRNIWEISQLTGLTEQDVTAVVQTI